MRLPEFVRRFFPKVKRNGPDYTERERQMMVMLSQAMRSHERLCYVLECRYSMKVKYVDLAPFEERAVMAEIWRQLGELPAPKVRA